MVLPLGGLASPGVRPGEPPPPQLLRFKVPLYAIAAGYGVVLIMGLVANQLSNALTNVFVLVAALLMASRADQCMGQCLMPFALFTIMTVFLDIVSLIASLSRPYPGASNLFSTSCLLNRTIILPQDTTVYDITNATRYSVPKDTKVLYPQDLCDWQWVLANTTMFLGIALDVVASVLGYRMLKVAMSLAPADDGGGIGRNPFTGLGGGGFGGPGGPGMGAGTGQELSSGRSTQAARPAGGFQPFQGPGQTLNPSG